MGTEDGQESDVLFLLNKIHWRRKVAIVRMVRTEDGEEEGVHFRGGERAVRVDGREKGRQGRGLRRDAESDRRWRTLATDAAKRRRSEELKLVCC